MLSLWPNQWSALLLWLRPKKADSGANLGPLIEFSTEAFSFLGDRRLSTVAKDACLKRCLQFVVWDPWWRCHMSFLKLVWPYNGVKFVILAKRVILSGSKGARSCNSPLNGWLKSARIPASTRVCQYLSSKYGRPTNSENGDVFQ